MFKKMLFSLIVVGLFSGVAISEEGGAYFKYGSLEFTYPLSNASVISLYDCWSGVGLMGVETSIANYKRLNLNFGAITSFIANGMPFLSLDFDWAGLIANSSETKLAKVGLWAGHDFKTNENRAGIKASIALW